MRGEYTFIDGESGDELELPPRARRILMITDRVAANKGTTSACAENTVIPVDSLVGYVELPPRARRIR